MGDISVGRMVDMAHYCYVAFALRNIYLTAESAKSNHLFIIMCQAAAKVKSCPSTAINSGQQLESIAMATRWKSVYIELALASSSHVHAPSAYPPLCQRKRKCTMAKGKRRPTTKPRVYLLSKGMGHTSAWQDKLQIFAGSLFGFQNFCHSAFQYLRHDPRWWAWANWAAVGWHRSFQASYPFFVWRVIGSQSVQEPPLATPCFVISFDSMRLLLGGQTMRYDIRGGEMVGDGRGRSRHTPPTTCTTHAISARQAPCCCRRHRHSALTEITKVVQKR